VEQAMKQKAVRIGVGAALAVALVLGCVDTRLEMKGTPTVSEAPPPFDLEMYKKIWLDDYPPSDPAEPKLAKMNEAKAIEFLDRVSVNWAKKNGCGTCHTNVPYLMARPLTAPGAERDSALAKVREGMVQYLKMPDNSGLRAFYVAPAAAAIAINDAETTGTMSREAMALFDELWKLQKETGDWTYPTTGLLPFLERDRRYVADLVALGAGYLPPAYRQSEKPRQGLRQLRDFYRRNPPSKAHDEAMLLWASVRWSDLLSAQQKSQYATNLLRLQKNDGGWNLYTLGTWPRLDGALSDASGGSDGYATGLVLTALCAAGYEGTDSDRINRGLQWIKENQRVSGRWYTRSTYSDRLKGYTTNLATAYAIMALKTCAAR
jgi:squalene-hopene/tetraprenyl-beta-curcumene cyclase